MNTKSFSEIAIDAAYEAFVPGYIKVLRTALTDSQGGIKTAESQGIQELQAEAQKQKIVMEFQAHQARVSQEIAIAERISTSNEVEITEYYDASGKGHAGLSAQESNVTAGVAGEGRKVTHRIIKFSGCNRSGADKSEGEQFT